MSANGEDKLSKGGPEWKGPLLERLRQAKSTPAEGRTERLSQERRVHNPPPRFDELPEFQRIQVQRDVSKLLGLENPFYRSHDGAAGATTSIAGRDLVNFASYDYLGLNSAAGVKDQAKAAVDHYGISSSASRVVAGERLAHSALENRLATVYGVEAAVSFVSGYLTNVAAISCLMGPQDIVIHDELAHNSILAGVKMSGATRRFFRHNDIAHLESILTSLPQGVRRVLVVVEGIYSMDGDTADLPALVALRSRFGFWLMVDEAHALGVLGPHGRGSFEHYKLDAREIDIWMGTLSKTTASCGGYVAGSQALIDILKADAGGFVYSVGLAPALAAAASASLDILAQEPIRCERLRHNGRHFLECAQAAGLDTGLSLGFSVVPVIVGDSLRAVKLSSDLLDEGINALPIIHPAVPEGSARLRFFLTADHTQDQIEYAVSRTAAKLKSLESQGYGLASLNMPQLIKDMAAPTRDENA